MRTDPATPVAAPTGGRLVAALLALPAVLTAVGLLAIEGIRAVAPDAPIFGERPPASLGDAITHGYPVEYAYAFIRAGQDPNAPIGIDNRNYAAEPVTASPLLVAVAARDGNVLRMLLDWGARPELPQNRYARCLARALENREAEDVLAAAGAPMDCPAAAVDRKAPLGWTRETAPSVTAVGRP